MVVPCFRACCVPELKSVPTPKNAKIIKIEEGYHASANVNVSHHKYFIPNYIQSVERQVDFVSVDYSNK